MDHPALLRANIKKLYILRACHFCWIFIPTFVLFCGEYDLGLKEVLLLKAAQSLFVFLLEVPSGYFADVIGRKTSLVLGGAVWFVSSIVYSLGTSFEVFLLAECLLGIALSLISGADSAIVYDTLQELGEEHTYKKTEGRLSSVAGFAEALGGLCGACIGAYALVYPFYATAAINVVSVLVALSLVEPTRDKLQVGGSKWKDILQIVRLTLFDHKGLRWIVYFTCLSGLGTFWIVWFAQSYMESISLPIAYFGVAWAVFHLALGLSSLAASSIEEKLGAYTTFFSFTCVLSISYVALSLFQNLWGLLFIIILYCVRGVRTPLARNHINSLISSDIRATVLSVQGFAFRIMYIVTAPLLGWITDAWRVEGAYIFIAIGLFVPSVVCLTLAARNKALG